MRQSKEIKLLGIAFNRDLNFSSHLHGMEGEKSERGLFKTLSSTMGVVKSIKHCPQRATRQFLASLINGRISFGIEVYGALSEGQLNQLQIIQNRAARLALPGNLKTSEKLSKLGWLNVRNIREKMDLTTLLKMRTHRSSPYFDRWLRSSRLPPSALLPEYEASHGILLRRSFLVRASSAWNVLPTEVRSAGPSVFKVRLKKHLLARQVADSEKT